MMEGVCSLCAIVRKFLIRAISLDHKKKKKRKRRNKEEADDPNYAQKGTPIMRRFFLIDLKLFEIY